MVIWVDELYISSKFRGHGFGSKFMEWMFKEYKNENLSFRLEVCPNNKRVKKLYESYGFKELEYIQMVK